MGRLTRAEVQEMNRRKVLGAARDEFGERGFRDAKIDRIAERAGLTRGAVYSNFPGKRALYFAVLADAAGRVTVDSPPGSVDTVREALGALARGRVARFPLSGAESAENPARDLPSVVLADAQTREPYAQLLKLDAIVLGMALEGLAGRGAKRLVPVAETVLTLLHGADQLAAAAPGFGDPFQVVAACEQLGEVRAAGEWAPPHLSYVAQARPVDEAWTPPGNVMDALRGEAVGLGEDGVVAVLGLHRLEAVEETVRAAPAGQSVTVVLVTGEPGELGPLARLTVAELGVALRQAFPRGVWPGVRVVHDEAGVLAGAVGVSGVSDATECAVRVQGGRVVARGEGRGAGYAVGVGGG
ncbi:TetR family transcriptional regulator [Streptomyces spiroverticillatus]|uniref:TetR family transcriptional regulator n=1 Tax=Streptomyces finlayi TaxID=67296 RepID=A0A919CAQ3_9ACTN|nr:TetR/AcrR family transcriptional regulator [Streptomyces finlayi]GHA14305.1 TetR family transcriptional regulator [Streptomyces spiroverticillatus]GHC97398.1 TetR family transcriptional regulator [Streptomyces finlayi]